MSLQFNSGEVLAEFCLARVSVAFDNDIGLPAEASAQAGVGQNGCQFGQNVFKSQPTWRNISCELGQYFSTEAVLALNQIPVQLPIDAD